MYKQRIPQHLIDENKLNSEGVTDWKKNMTAGYKHGALRACCGGGGPYNYNMSASCGLPGATTCEDPDAHVSWDGVHLTEAPYRFIANTWLKGPYAHPPLISVLRDDMVY
jgi:hypothetical protein